MTMRTVLLALIGGVLGAVLFGLAHNAMYARSFGVVQLDQVIAKHMREIAETEMTDEERQKSGVLFAQALDKAIGELRADGVFLVVSQAVVTSEADYTDIVENRISELMYEPIN